MMNNMMNNINNQIGMNPMGIMNEFSMDETAQNVKFLIKPYEDKIRQLEEIIKQKDFEIAVLKQKLIKNNSNNNLMNMNPINMNVNQINPMNMMVQNIPNNQPNQHINDQGKEINLKIIKENKEYHIKCYEGELASVLKSKCQIGRGSFNYKYKPLKSNLTLKENGLVDNSIIQFKTKMMNLVFNGNNGKLNSVVLSYDCPLGIAIIYYIMEYESLSYLISLINDEDIIAFLFNDIKLKIKDNTPIGTFFDETPWPNITVVVK